MIQTKKKPVSRLFHSALPLLAEHVLDPTGHTVSILLLILLAWLSLLSLRILLILLLQHLLLLLNLLLLLLA